jgi:hypothetical protein
MDGACPGFGWKTVCQLQPARAVAAVVSLNWAPFSLAHAVVLMVAAVPGDSAPAFPVQLALNDGPIAPGSPGVPFSGGGAAYGAASGAPTQAPHGTHIANMPQSLISAFIEPGGRNVKAMCQQYGNCKVGPLGCACRSMSSQGVQLNSALLAHCNRLT